MNKRLIQPGGFWFLPLLIFFIFYFMQSAMPQNISINTTGAANSSLSMLEILQISATANSKGLYVAHTGTITGTGYGILSEITGTSTTNIAGQFAATGGTNNYALIVPPNSGIVGIGTTAPTANYLTTFLTNGTIENGISINLSGAGATAYGINISSASYRYRNILSSNSASSSSGVYFSVGGELTSGVALASGYLGYHTGGADLAANYFAGYFQGKVAVTSNSSPDGIADLEVQNTTAGAGNPATVFLRQTTSNTTSGTVLANLNFGDNHSTSPQAQIQVIRGAAGGSGDLPTDMLFYTTPDGSATLTERMRITNKGNVGIGGVPFSTTFLDLYPTTGMTEGLWINMPSNTASNTALGITNTATGSTATKYGINSTVSDNNAITKYGVYSQATGTAGTKYGGLFNASGAGTNYGIHATANANTGDFAAYFNGIIGIAEQTITPSTPAANTEIKMYVKADKLVIQFYNGTTTKYWYLDLTSTTNQNWTYTTTAP